MRCKPPKAIYYEWIGDVTYTIGTIKRMHRLSGGVYSLIISRLIQH